jgi:uncharacterized protein involved in exopolysaccharide biosynthesis
VTIEEINSEAELLKSQDVLEKVVLENGLEEKEKQSFWAHLFPEQNESQYVSLAVKHLGQKLKIETPHKNEFNQRQLCFWRPSDGI